MAAYAVRGLMDVVHFYIATRGLLQGERGQKSKYKWNGPSHVCFTPISPFPFPKPYINTKGGS
jgi:hypothetical protein